MMAISIPIVAIIAGCGVALANSMMRHRERMAMIEQGMHPDDRQARDAFRASKKGKTPKEAAAGGWTDYVPPKC
ncbi:MAG: hypothetical protein FJ297_02900 [Planctomycetes bacterium]|nr:hypothetical protein [Planctomycetota bacterium]